MLEVKTGVVSWKNFEANDRIPWVRCGPRSIFLRVDVVNIGECCCNVISLENRLAAMLQDACTTFALFMLYRTGGAA
jgi:hypothetical protein